MTPINYSERIDFNLLNQYQELLGKDGIQHSLSTLESLIPSYMAELEQMNSAQHDPDFRRQAHKIKGACRSLGFVRVGEAMQFLERDDWTWAQADAVIEQSQAWLEVDLAEVKGWLAETSASD